MSNYFCLEFTLKIQELVHYFTLFALLYDKIVTNQTFCLTSSCETSVYTNALLQVKYAQGETSTKVGNFRWNGENGKR